MSAGKGPGDTAGTDGRGGAGVPGRGAGPGPAPQPGRAGGAAGGGGSAPASAGPPRCSLPAAREEETAGRSGSSGAAPRRRTPGGRQLRAPPLPATPGPMAGPAAPRAPPRPWAALLLLLAALLPAAAPGRQPPRRQATEPGRATCRRPRVCAGPSGCPPSGWGGRPGRGGKGGGGRSVCKDGASPGAEGLGDPRGSGRAGPFAGQPAAARLRLGQLRASSPPRALPARRELRATEGCFPLASSPWLPYSRWHRVLAPSSRRAPLPRFTALTPGRPRAEHLFRKSGEIPLFSSFPPPEH